MKIKVKIPAIVTADQRWAACASHTSGEPDWSWIDEMCDDMNPTVRPQRYMIEVELEVPENQVVTVAAGAVEPA